MSRLCGCYHCLNTFTRWDIKEWVEDIYVHAVPLCPFCQQDSVIGDAHGYPITEELLKEIRNYCYDEDEWWGEWVCQGIFSFWDYFALLRNKWI